MLRRIIRGFCTTLVLVSRIPVPFRFTPDYRLTGFMLPVIGFLAGGLLLGVTVVVYTVFLRTGAGFGSLGMSDPGAFLVSLLVLPGYYLLFNLFHFDGLLDSADALLYQGDRERRLAMLKDSKIGTYALFTGVVYLISKVYLFSGCIALMFSSARAYVLLLFLFPVFARLTASFIPLVLKPAKKTGLGALLAPYRILPVMIGLILVIVCFSAMWVFRFGELSGDGKASTVVLRNMGGGGESAIGLCLLGLLLLSQVIVFLPMWMLYARRVGGYTGDTLGAAIELGELSYLFFVFLLFSSSI